jgi:hypothetical protein
MYTVTYGKDGKEIDRKIVDDRHADMKPLVGIMCEMYREHLAREGGAPSCATSTASILKRPTVM